MHRLQTAEKNDANRPLLKPNQLRNLISSDGPMVSSNLPKVWTRVRFPVAACHTPLFAVLFLHRPEGVLDDLLENHSIHIV